MRFRFLLLPLTGVLLSAPVSRAGIEFEKTESSLTAKHTDTEIPVSFSFKVTGDRAVQVLDLQTFCSCLSAQTDGNKKIYQPGESGKVEAIFELGSFEGQQTKEVILRTDDPDHKETKLRVTIEIPPLFLLEPSQLVWVVGEAPAKKSLHVKMVGDEAVAVTAAISTRNEMAVEVKEITAGREYEIQMTPKSTENPLLGLVRLETDCKYPRYQRRLVFFNISRPKPAPDAPPAVAPAAAPETGAPPVPEVKD